MTQLTDNVFSVKVPEGATGCYYDGRYSIGFYLNGELRFVHMFPGSYEFMFTTDGASEEDARKVVPKIYNYSPDTLLAEIFAEVSVDTHLETLQSLLRSKNLEGNHAIIKKR